MCAIVFADARVAAAEGTKEFLFLSANLYGYIDKTGKQVIEPKFRRAEEFSEGVAAVAVGIDNKWCYIDHEGKLLGTPQFQYLPPLTDGLAPVQIENRFYYVDRAGNQVISAPHEQFTWTAVDASRFSEGLAGVFVSHSCEQASTDAAPAAPAADGWGYIDKQGKLVVDAKFLAVRPFSEGLAGVRIDTKWGFIDRTGQVVVPPQFDWVMPFSEGFAAVQKGPHWGFIDKSGKVLGNFEYAALGNFSEGLAAVRVGDKWGYSDTAGNLVISPQYFMAQKFSGGLAPVAVVKKWGFINKKGELVVSPEYRDARPFSDGLARVQVESGAGSAAYGYIDPKGTLVIQPGFESAGDFFEELAYVSPVQTVVARIPALATLLPPGKEQLVDLAKLTPNEKRPPVEKALATEGDTVSINLPVAAGGATPQQWLIREHTPKFFEYGHVRTTTACLEQIDRLTYRAVRPGKETIDVVAKRTSDREAPAILLELDVQPAAGSAASARTAKLKELQAEFDKISRSEIDNPQYDSYMHDLQAIANEKMIALEVRQLADETLTVLQKKRQPAKRKLPPPRIRVR